MKGPTPHRVWNDVTRRLRLRSYFQAPGDGRVSPQIPARPLLWSLLMGHLLREPAFPAIEARVRSASRRAWGVGRRFGG